MCQAVTDPRAVRLNLGLNQSQFWSRVGVTQSGGSRYENDVRQIPVTVQSLLTIAYGTERQSQKAVESLRPAK